MKKLFSVLALVILSGCAIPSTPMQIGKHIAPPSGAVEFCAYNAQDCKSATTTAKIEMTAKRFEQLEDVQWEVNSTIKYRSDSKSYGKSELWAFPTRYGDCEDFAIEKRRRLINLGWPYSSLLLTTASTKAGLGHMVLTVVTDQGDYVLDLGLRRNVKSWEFFDYEWKTRQSQSKDFYWNDITMN